MYFITTKRMLEVCFSAHPNIQYRTCLLFNRKSLLLNKKRSRRSATLKRACSLSSLHSPKRPAAGGESRERDSFLIEDANLHAPRTG